MSANGTISGGTSGRSINAMPTSIRPKKKPAPPRPPQPKINRLQNSVSFNTAQDLSPHRPEIGRMRPMTTAGKDLIDFSTPPASPNSGRRNTVSNISTARNDPNEFSYRVGASIFYIKSPLKNSVSEAPIQNPFSPPRPTADSIITNQNQQKPVHLPSNLNAAWNSPAKSSSSTQQASVWDTPPKIAANSNTTVATSSVPKVGTAVVPNSQTQNNSSQDNNNTIKSHYQNQASWTRAEASSSSNASSDRTSASFSDIGSNLQHQQQQQPRYTNVPDTLKKELSATLSSGSGAGSKPTIIRPVNKLPAQSSAEGSSMFSSRGLMNSIKNQEKSDTEITTKVEQDEISQRNFYDVPPDEEDDDFDDEANDSSLMASPPMPSEPPPPPPPDVLAVDEWVSSTTSVMDYPDTYSDAGQVTAYAIALYDFIPEASGDLQLQAGDLVYLLRKVDDQWYHGSCGGMEGMFPSNFVNVMVPIPDDSYQSQDTPQLEEDNSNDLLVDVLYDFSAETEGDLGLQTGEKVKILGRINEDWLYGEKSGTKGQFPAAFVEQITQDLPAIKI